VTTIADAAPPLSMRLREETKDAHTRAERSGIMRRVLRGTIERAAYVDLLDQLHAIYGALEGALERHATHRLIAPFAFGRLRRLPRLDDDLAVLGADLLRCGGAADATRTLARRIHDAAPERLVAHAYVRYLGDLSGGQILRRLVARALALPDDAGTRVYDFAPHDAERLKHAFRAALDALPLDPADADALVDEARHAFALHEALFVELDAR
jgi:heme oxygenase